MTDHESHLTPQDRFTTFSRCTDTGHAELTARLRRAELRAESLRQSLDVLILNVPSKYLLEAIRYDNTPEGHRLADRVRVNDERTCDCPPGPPHTSLCVLKPVDVPEIDSFLGSTS